MKFYAIIPAGGSGIRFGGDQKKQYLLLHGKEILFHVTETFLSLGLFEKIVVSLPPADYHDYLSRLDHLRIGAVQGGETRAESVYNGFCHLSLKDDDVVLVHDAVRPLVSRRLIESVLKKIESCDAVVPVLPVSDTLKEVRKGVVVCTADRQKFHIVQTPQGFKAGVLKRAYQQFDKNATDEAMLVESLGETVYTVPGERENIKITTPLDFKLAEVFLCV